MSDEEPRDDDDTETYEHEKWESKQIEKAADAGLHPFIDYRKSSQPPGPDEPTHHHYDDTHTFRNLHNLFVKDFVQHFFAPAYNPNNLPGDPYGDRIWKDVGEPAHRAAIAELERRHAKDLVEGFGFIKGNRYHPY